MKLGVIGFGTRLVHVVNDCMRKADTNLRVVAAIDPSEDAVRKNLPDAEAKEIRFFQSVEDLVAEGGVDAIAIGTRCNLHSKYAIEVATTGLPLFLEKPVATNLEDAIALEAAFRKSKCEVVVSFPLRASPLCRRVKSLLSSGVIAKPEHVLAVNYVPYGDVYFNSWYRDYSVTGGLFLQKATHDFDYLMYCVGSPIVKVAATRSCGRVFKDLSQKPSGAANESAFYENIGRPEDGMNEDASNALLEFANGTRGLYTQVFYSKDVAAERGATFSGYRGTIKFDWYNNRATVAHHFEPFKDTLEEKASEDHHGGDDVLAANFVQVVRGEAKSISTIWDGLESVFACLAARKSAETETFQSVYRMKPRDDA